jgi:hypothetical protein
MIRYICTVLFLTVTAKGDATYSLLSQSLGARITYGVFTGLGFPQYKNASDCMLSTQHLVDDFYEFSVNVSIAEQQNVSAFQNAELFYSASNIVSTSIRDFALHCPLGFTYWIKDVTDHFSKFENATITEVAESATFNLLAKSIVLRKQYIDLQFYLNQSDTANVVFECVKLAKNLVFFENLYANPATTSAFETTYSAEFPKRTLAMIKQKANKYLYRAFAQSVYRFSDFFLPFSYTR